LNVYGLNVLKFLFRTVRAFTGLVQAGAVALTCDMSIGWFMFSSFDWLLAIGIA
jgi:hypothetical protein